jgi:acyl carrier protein
MRANHKFKVYEFADDAMSDAPTVSRDDVRADICRRLDPFRTDGRPITGATVITKDLNIDSLAVMDMVMELEDTYDISIPLNVVAEIHTVDELTDTVLKIRGER